MSKTRTKIILLIFLIFSSAMPAMGKDAFTEKEKIKLIKGKLVIRSLPSSGKNALIGGSSFLLVDATHKEIWQALDDVDNWEKIFPKVLKSRYITGTDKASAVALTVGHRILNFDFSLTLLKKRREGEMIIKLNKKRPSDVKEIRGKLRLIPASGGRTLIAMSFMIKVPFGGILGFMGDRGIKYVEKELFHLLVDLKKWLKKRIDKLRGGKLY